MMLVESYICVFLWLDKYIENMLIHPLCVALSPRVPLKRSFEIVALKWKGG